MDERSDHYLARLSSSDRMLLQLSVRMNPIMVANADGDYSLREFAAIADAVHKLVNEPAFRPLLLVAGQEKFSEAALRVMLEEHSKDLDGYLAQIASLLEHLPEEVADAYRRFTLYAVIHTAEASRDGLFGLVGAKISDSEKSVIRKMVDVLRINPSEIDRAKLGI